MRIMKRFFTMVLLTMMGFGVLANVTPAGAASNHKTISGTSRNEQSAHDGETVMLNSNPNGDIGDEQYFVRALKIGGEEEKDNAWEKPGQEIEVSEDCEYLVDVYVINDTSNSIAKDVKATVIFPDTLSDHTGSQKQTISAIISASNTEQAEYTSDITFKSAGANIQVEPIHSYGVYKVDRATLDLEAIDSSLFAYGTVNSYGTTASPEWVEERRRQGSDMSLFNEKEPGVLIGDNLDGNISYGPDNMQIIRFWVKIKCCYSYSWQSEVSPTFKRNEALISFTYTNNDPVPHKDVKIGFDFNLEEFEIIPGSVTLKDGRNPDGIPLKDSEVTMDTNNGPSYIIGYYAPGEQAIITCRVKTRKGADFDEKKYYFVNAGCDVGSQQAYEFGAMRVISKSIVGLDGYGNATQDFKTMINIRILIHTIIIIVLACLIVFKKPISAMVRKK